MVLVFFVFLICGYWIVFFVNLFVYLKGCLFYVLFLVFVEEGFIVKMVFRLLKLDVKILLVV